MASGGKSGGAPTTVAEGLGDVLNAIVRCQQAPDAVHFAGPLLKLQTTVLDLVHGPAKQGAGQPGGGPPPGGGAPAGPPPGGGAPPGGSPLMGGLAGLQGAGQGPSAATSGAGPSLSGMDPEEMRQKALMGSDQ